MLKSALSLLYAGTSTFARTGTEAILPVFYGFATKAAASTTKSVSKSAKIAAKSTKAPSPKTVKAASSKTAKAATSKTSKAVPAKIRKAAESKEKRPANAYALFLKENFQAYKHGDEKAPVVARKVATAWTSLTEAQKKPYLDRAQPAITAYLQKKAAEEVTRKANAVPPAYILFFQEMRPKIMKENPGLKVTEAAKISGEKWRALTDAQKATYKKQSEAVKAAKSATR